MRTDLLWFRRDLRLTDHPALTAAADADRLVCVFVADEALLGSPRMSPARLVYLRHALADLAANLQARGNRLVIRTGDPAQVVPALATEVGAAVVHVSADHTPYATRRDAAVREALDAAGVAFEGHGGIAIAPPGSVRTGSGSVYKVVTPFHRAWRDREHGAVLDAPAELPPDVGGVDGLGVTDIGLMDADGPPEPWPDGGETAARLRLEIWLEEGVEDYADRRDVMAVDGTSRLSPDFHFGCLSPREVWTTLDRRGKGPQIYGSELAWRDFYLHVMAEWPESAARAFRPEYADLPWIDDDEAFDAWCEGRTGYPVVDAAMRQLLQMGWMHNRARMIVASFLCKDLLVDWRRGEAHFLQHLVDGDVPSNNGGWQWAAGTGTDAQPFFRIFNPVTQGKRFDPDGDYVRRYVPELATLPAPAIHAPWELSEARQEEHGVRIGVDYPEPIVDHAEARQRALSWFEQHKG
ncbi:deoxyribodipyrimidine photo-lyase [soil metagenome]